MLLKLGKVLHGMQKEEKEKKGEEGFTLIELLVVVIIIGILAAIAIPIFLGQRERAQDAATVSDLRSAASAMETYYVDDQTFVGADADEMAGIEPSITWVDGAGGEGEVGIDTASLGEETYALTSTSESDNVYTIARSANGTTEPTLVEEVEEEE